MLISTTIPRRVPGAREMRRKLIRNVYAEWKRSVPGQKVWNNSLHDYINVNALSITETANWASLSYKSTLAVLHLDHILRYSQKWGKPYTPKNNQNQKLFNAIQEMKCYLPNVGWVKMTVGIRKYCGEKLQYCITAIRT